MTDQAGASGARAVGEPIEPDDVDDAASTIQKVVAVTIMVVTLCGAALAVAQTQAENRENTASRNQQIASVQTAGESTGAGRSVNREHAAWELWYDQSWLEELYRQAFDDEGSEFAAALAAAHGDAAEDLAEESPALSSETYQLPDDDIDWARFFEDQYRSSYASTEYERAHAVERDQWSDKATQLVTAITILAVALFLLGLSLTVPGTAQLVFVTTGLVVALVGTSWGATIWARPVDEPRPAAIDAYVDGLVLTNAGREPADFEQAVAHFTAAIEERPDYIDAHVGRGNAYFAIDFRHPDGPQGSVPAREDFQRAIELGLDDFIAWGNLGAAQWWLGEYEPALASTRRAYEDKPTDLVVSFNYAEAILTVEGLDSPAYQAQLDHLQRLLEAAPAWLRDLTTQQFYEAQDLAIRYRPELAERNGAYKEAVLRMHHQIEMSNELYGEPQPPPVDATVGALQFQLSADHTELEVDFDYEGVEPDQQWSYRTYRDGSLDSGLSIEPEPWSFPTPDGGVILTFTDGEGFEPGTVIRTEVFIEGNLLSAGEFTVP